MLDEPSLLANTGFEFRLELRRRSLTWSLRGKTVLIHKGREVARLGKVLLVQVQLRFHVLQGGPLVAGGGGQLLFVRGVVVLRVGAAFIHRRRILQRGEVSAGQGRLVEPRRRRLDEEAGTHRGEIRQRGLLWRSLHSESITETKTKFVRIRSPAAAEWNLAVCISDMPGSYILKQETVSAFA